MTSDFVIMFACMGISWERETAHSPAILADERFDPGMERLWRFRINEVPSLEHRQLCAGDKICDLLR